MIFGKGRATPPHRRSPKTSSQTGRVPLTKYYRSGKPSNGEGSPFKSSHPKISRLQRWLIKLSGTSLLILMLVILAYSLIVKPTPKLLVSDTSYRPGSTYQQAVEADLSSLKNRNKVTLDEAGIEAHLTKQFPEVSYLSVELPLFSQTAVLRLEIAKPALYLSSDSQSYVISAQGKAIELANNLPQIKNLPLVIDQSGFKPEVGKQALNTAEVNFIITLVNQLKRSQIAIQSIVLPTRAQELDLRVADRPYFVKFYLGGDALLQTGQYLAAKHNFDQLNSQPEQYLDVRVSGKVFYK